MFGTLPSTGGINPIRLLFILVALVVFSVMAVRKMLSST